MLVPTTALARGEEQQVIQKAVRIELVSANGSQETAEKSAIRIEHAEISQATAAATSYSQSDALLLAKIIYGESNSESMEGKIAVGTVIMNRVKSSKFPNSVHGVIYQKGQFSGSKSQYNSNCMEAAVRVLKGERNLPGSVMYFKSSRLGRSWGSRTFHCTIGGHYFYK